MRKIYTYTNDIGRIKKVGVDTEATEKGHFMVIVDMATGEFCGSGYNPTWKLKEFFNHYGIEEKDFDTIFGD